MQFTLYPHGYLDLRYELVPEQRKCPSDMIPILSPRYSASSSECVVRIIILFVLNLLSTCHSPFFAITSIPLVGSSSRISLLFPIRAMAIHNFLFCPPDKVDEAASFFVCRPSSVIKVFTSSLVARCPFSSLIR